jgi:hypothetical protein
MGKQENLEEKPPDRPMICVLVERESMLNALQCWNCMCKKEKSGIEIFWTGRWFGFADVGYLWGYFVEFVRTSSCETISEMNPEMGKT